MLSSQKALPLLCRDVLQQSIFSVKSQLQDVAPEHPNTSWTVLPEQTMEAHNSLLPLSQLAARESDTVPINFRVPA